jgi:hypothetical protein
LENDTQMKIVILFAAISLISFHCAFAQVIKDPIRDFLFSPDEDSVIDLPYLKYLYVLKCDLDGSGKLATLISFEGGRQGYYWTVYLPSKGGYVKADDAGVTLTFGQDTFYIGHVNQRYGLLAFAPGRGGGDLNLYQIVRGKLTENKIASLDLSTASDKKVFQKIFWRRSQLEK